MALRADAAGVRVTFQNTAPRTFDLVVGADGLHPGVRALAFGPEEQFVCGLGINVAAFSVRNHLGLERWETACPMAGRTAALYALDRGANATAQLFFLAPESEPRRYDLTGQFAVVADAFAGRGWEIPRLLAGDAERVRLLLRHPRPRAPGPLDQGPARADRRRRPRRPPGRLPGLRTRDARVRPAQPAARRRSGQADRARQPRPRLVSAGDDADAAVHARHPQRH